MKTVKWALALLALVATAIIYYFQFWIPQQRGVADFYAASYSGVVMKIEKRKGHRVAHHVLIDSTWHLFNWESEIIPSMHVGDSIIKEENSYLVKLYRRDSAGRYQEVNLTLNN